jgi:hypothetical protein
VLAQNNFRIVSVTSPPSYDSDFFGERPENAMRDETRQDEEEGGYETDMGEDSESEVVPILDVVYDIVAEAGTITEEELVREIGTDFIDEVREAVGDWMKLGVIVRDELGLRMVASTRPG